MNIEFATKVLNYLTDHPEAHNQRFFGHQNACGTQACVAGTAVLLDENTIVRWWHGGSMNVVVQVGDTYDTIVHRAEHLLGITHIQAARLFYDTYDNAAALNLLGQYIAEALVAETFTEAVPA